MRASSLSADRCPRLVPVPGRGNAKALVPPSCPRTLDPRPVLEPLLAAERAIAGSAAVVRRLPRPDLIIRGLERRDAVLSSQTEGTRTDLTQLLEYEATGSAEGMPDDAAVTLGYVRALDLGLGVVRRSGGRDHLTLDLIQQMHSVLMAGSAYPYPEGPGAWRQAQAWIGGRRIEDASLSRGAEVLVRNRLAIGLRLDLCRACGSIPCNCRQPWSVSSASSPPFAPRKPGHWKPLNECT